jgi:hypothetical protein
MVLSEIIDEKKLKKIIIPGGAPDFAASGQQISLNWNHGDGPIRSARWPTLQNVVIYQSGRVAFSKWVAPI